MSRETETERRVWEMLARDFYSELPADLEVRLYGDSEQSCPPVKLQIFEVVTAEIFARLRPEYEWYVTPNRPDGGLDFIGSQRFLEDEALGIAAAITVGGQCKKRTRLNDIVGEVAGSLVRMADTVNPTFFVIALSARLKRERVDSARAILERTVQRHCHILDRGQIEGLMTDHLDAIEGIIREGLSAEESHEVLEYFRGRRPPQALVSVDIAAPTRVLAGVPFSVALKIRSPLAAPSGMRIWWRTSGLDEEDETVSLIGPVGADTPVGAKLDIGAVAEDPVGASHSVELVTYSVGDVEMGDIFIGVPEPGALDGAQRFALGRLQVVENVRPRFFERPFRGGVQHLSQSYDRALAGGIASVGVVGAGGSGKSRLCEEFSLERRRHGAGVVSAKQAKTLNDPHRILADLFSGLVSVGDGTAGTPERIVNAIACYDSDLADKAGPSIRSIFGTSDSGSGTVAEQHLLSALLLLIVAHGRRSPLVLHLQDLHWCTADVLLMLERLAWQLDHVLSASDALPRRPESGVFFLFEGRIREREKLGEDGWASEPFEAFLQKLDCPLVRCGSFTQDDGLEFIRRMFEDRYSARRQVSLAMLVAQGELVEQVDRAAGGNPFHSLEQVQLLKDRSVLGQNRRTGLLYLSQPAPTHSLLPDSVFEAIQLRWRYLQSRTPSLALLVWAAALLEDRIPGLLFRRLWDEIAPDVSRADIDGTDILWTGDGDMAEVAFRHENYFQSIRQFVVSPSDRKRVVDIYSGWFEEGERRDAGDRFSWARVLLELPEPDVNRARVLLDSALFDAREAGDARLGRRISATLLDLAWQEDARSPTDLASFVGRCDEDLLLIRDLLASDRSQAKGRLDRLRGRLRGRLESEGGHSLTALLELRRRALTAEVLRSQILYNDRRPALAAQVSSEAVKAIAEARNSPLGEEAAWDALEMEALHSQAVALALSGEIDEALRTSAMAVKISRRSPSELSRKVVGTYANILLARDPADSELILRRCLEEITTGAVIDEAQSSIEVNLGMALVLLAYKLGVDDERAQVNLSEARELLSGVVTNSFRLGRYLNAGAAALMLGIVSALEQDGEAATWFAQAVAAAARGHKMETLWRAHINLATATFQRDGDAAASVRDHARAALEILEESLSSYPQADRTARFDLIRAPLAQAVRFLLLADDDAGRAALNRYPKLRSSFTDVTEAALREDRGPGASHEWLHVAGELYVIY
jgi:hypothetical protein